MIRYINPLPLTKLFPFKKPMKVFVLGYSEKPERYSNMALNLLKDHGHEAIGINPQLPPPVEKTLLEALHKHGRPDTVTLYLRPELSTKLEDDLLRSGARRVIFNPGTENPDLQEKLKKAGIEVEEACTLVLLRTGQF